MGEGADGQGQGGGGGELVASFGSALCSGMLFAARISSTTAARSAAHAAGSGGWVSPVGTLGPCVCSLLPCQLFCPMLPSVLLHAPPAALSPCPASCSAPCPCMLQVQRKTEKEEKEEQKWQQDMLGGLPHRNKTAGLVCCVCWQAA